jgi:hypothetical protein
MFLTGAEQPFFQSAIRIAQDTTLRRRIGLNRHDAGSHSDSLPGIARIYGDVEPAIAETVRSGARTIRIRREGREASPEFLGFGFP